MTRRFRSKIDLWLLTLLILVLVMQSYLLTSTILGNAPSSAKYVMIGVTILVFLLIGSILLRTHYTVAGDMLTIVSGPIRRTVMISDIQQVSETRNLLSSPALSLDRLRIEYGNGKSVMVSPGDKKEFLSVIRQKLA